MQRTFGFLVCFFFASAVAQAQESGQDPRVGEAKTACVGGDLQKGIRLLAELYTASGDPIWLFNQGRCFQQNDQLTQALSRFKEFLRKSEGAPGEDVADARKYIAELEAELQKAQPASKSPAAPSAEPSVAVSTTAGPAAPETRPGRGLRYTGLGTIIAGGAFLATGAVFSVLVNKSNKDIESQTNQGTGVDWSAVSGKYSDGSRYETLQWVFYGVGAAATIAGSVLYWMGMTPAEPRVSAAHVFPVFVANGAGAGLHMAF
jgi:hypothetical protein